MDNTQEQNNNTDIIVGNILSTKNNHSNFCEYNTKFFPERKEKKQRILKFSISGKNDENDEIIIENKLSPKTKKSNSNFSEYNAEFFPERKEKKQRILKFAISKKI